MSEVSTIACLLVMFAMGYSLGYGGGQIKAMREHLAFLRESSKRADEMHADLIAATSKESP